MHLHHSLENFLGERLYRCHTTFRMLSDLDEQLISGIKVFTLTARGACFTIDITAGDQLARVDLEDEGESPVAAHALVDCGDGSSILGQGQHSDISMQAPTQIIAKWVSLKTQGRNPPHLKKEEVAELAGDYDRAPRRGELWAKLEAWYGDHVPKTQWYVPGIQA